MEKLKKEETENPEAASTEQDGSQADDACAQTETVDPQTETADDNTSSAATDEQSDAATDGDSEADKVQELGQKLVEVQDRYTRLYAEFENYRRRTGAEKIELQLSGHREMAKAILPVLDDLERALAAMPDSDASKEGVKLIYDKMLSILQQKGVKPMTTIGEAFNPDLHEAVTQIPASGDMKKNQVFDEVLKGYYINDKVLRHAKVVVAI